MSLNFLQSKVMKHRSDISSFLPDTLKHDLKKFEDILINFNESKLHIADSKAQFHLESLACLKVFLVTHRETILMNFTGIGKKIGKLTVIYG